MRTLAISFVLAMSGWSTRVAAHDLGVSRMELTEREDGTIHGHFTFAAREAAAAFDRDGHVAVEVRTDEKPCTPGDATSARQGDGLVIDEDFACTKATTSIEAIAYFVTQMGGSHEDVASIETAESTHQELLTPSHRAISVALHRRRESPRTGKIAAIVASLGLVAAALLGFAIRSILRRRQ